MLKNNEKFEEFFIPEQKDSIFWCWIIFKFGLGKYIVLKDNTFTTEKTHKINFIEKIRKNKKNLKLLRRFKKISDIESNLANENFLLLQTLEIMLYVEKYNFIFMNDKIYYENISWSENKTCIIKYFINSEKYGIFLENNEKVTTYKNKLFNVENITKPIKSISSYKAQDIKDICNKLNINIMKTPTKCKNKKRIISTDLSKNNIKLKTYKIISWFIYIL